MTVIVDVGQRVDAAQPAVHKDEVDHKHDGQAPRNCTAADEQQQLQRRRGEEREGGDPPTSVSRG